VYIRQYVAEIEVHQEMNLSQSIFAVIPSNSLAESYPENKSSDFTVPLSYHLSFPSGQKWKVALLEIQVPVTFFNIDDSGQDNYLILKKGTHGETVKLSPGLYQSAIDLVQEINSHIRKIQIDFKLFKHDQTTGKVYVQLKEGEAIVFSRRIARILSLPRKLRFSPRGRARQVFKSRTVADPWRDFHHLFVYSDIVEDRILNGSTAPLLQTVSVTNKTFGNLLIRSYFPPEFLKTRYEHYSTARFWITNEVEDPVRFRSGSVVMKLQFQNDSFSGN